LLYYAVEFCYAEFAMIGNFTVYRVTLTEGWQIFKNGNSNLFADTRRDRHRQLAE